MRNDDCVRTHEKYCVLGLYIDNDGICSLTTTSRAIIPKVNQIQFYELYMKPIQRMQQ